MAGLRDWARALKRDVLALWLASRDPRTPAAAKVLAVVVVAYAFSPIDLIPDFVPVLGYLDDVILLPIGIWLVLKLIPPELMVEFGRETPSPAPLFWSPPLLRGRDRGDVIPTDGAQCVGRVAPSL